MKKLLFSFALAALVIGGANAQGKKPIVKSVAPSLNGKTLTVYTTADSSKLRLSVTDKLVFGQAVQPTEGEVSVFVEPSKSFQTFMGIGGAITDASAEVFAKLSKEKQQEFLKAY